MIAEATCLANLSNCTGKNFIMLILLSVCKVCVHFHLLLKQSLPSPGMDTFLYTGMSQPFFFFHCVLCVYCLCVHVWEHTHPYSRGSGSSAGITQLTDFTQHHKKAAANQRCPLLNGSHYNTWQGATDQEY